MNEFLAAPLELKAIGGTDEGTFSGYGAVFGNVDVIGDKILPGAFADTLAERKLSGRPLPMHFNHGLPDVGGERAIGVWRVVEEDNAGLRVEGKISGMGTDRGRFYFERLRDGAISGLSIGFKAKSVAYGRTGAPGEARRTISALSLAEVSIVDDPANPHARISGVKSGAVAMLARLDEIKSRFAVGEPLELREFEAALRDAFGLSRAQAVTIAAHGYKALARESESGGEALPPAVKSAVESLDAVLRGFTLPKG